MKICKDCPNLGICKAQQFCDQEDLSDVIDDEYWDIVEDSMEDD
jgi:hypothetical protein